MKKTLMRASACLFALALLGSATATAASAAPQFHTESSPSFLFGQSTNTVVAFSGVPENIEISCNKLTLRGEVVGTVVKTVSLHPEFAGCDVNEIPSSIAVPASCNFRFNQPNVSDQSTFSLTGCPSTAPIKWTTTGCTLEISEAGNSNISATTFSPQGTGLSRSLEMSLALSHMTYKQNAGCPGGAGTLSNMSITGSLMLRAYNNAAHTIQHGLWIE